MTKKQKFLFLITVILFGLAFGFDRVSQPEALMANRAQKIGEYIRTQKTESETWLNEFGTYLNQGISTGTGSGSVPDAIIKSLEGKEFSILLFSGNTLQFWSNNSALPPGEGLPSLLKGKTPRVVNFPQGDYFLYREKYKENTLCTLIPVQYKYGYESHTFWARFFSNKPLEPGLQVHQELTDYPVYVSDAQSPAFYIQNTPNSGAFSNYQWYRLGLYVLFLLALFTIVNEISMFLAKRYKNIVGSLFLIVAIMAFALVKDSLNLSENFSDLRLFQAKFSEQALGGSLGEWLINICILLWLMVFFHREFRVDTFANFPKTIRLVLCIMYYLAMMACTLVSVALFKTLVFFSGIDFDFDNLLDLDMYGLIGLSGIILVLSAMFLFSHRMMLTIFRFELNRNQRVISLMIASVITFFGSQLLDLGITPLYIVAFCLIFVIIFDFFLDQPDSDNFLWVVVWLSLFSVFSGLLLYRYGTDRDVLQRLQYAKVLAADADSLALENMVTLHEAINGASELNQLIRPFPFTASADSLHNFVLKMGAPTSYLFQHYDFQPFLFTNDGRSILDKNLTDFPGDSIARLYSAADPYEKSPHIRTTRGTLADKLYIIKLDVLRYDDEDRPATLFAVFYHKKVRTSPVYGDIFFKKSFKGLENLDKYDYTVYQDGKIRYQKGSLNESINPEKYMPAAGTARVYYQESGSRVGTIFSREDGKVTVIIGRQSGGMRKTIFLIAALFTLLSLFLIILATMNSAVRMLPDYYHFIITTKGSLAKRIQYFTVALIFASLIVIGYLTYHNFRKSSSNRVRELMDQKNETLVNNLLRRLEESPASLEEQRTILGNSLFEMARDFQVDVHLYGVDGTLINSSRQDLFSAGLLPSKMGANAYIGFQKLGLLRYMESEQIGNFEFETQYIAFHRENEIGAGRSAPIGYLGMPYFVKDAEISPDESDFFGLIIAVYVLLLIIASVMTVVTARAITSPLGRIVENIKKLQLEDKNEPLSIDSAGLDELTTLIEEYNRMVSKLEESTKNIVSLEKESAWRSMARQVAHEITNPLTTMKLSMQQLERLSQSDREKEEIQAYLKKTIRRFIEQIDGLAQIASEFSMFAKMEIPQRYDIELNGIVESVFDLFSEREDVFFELEMPEDTYHILGERTHLVRVFNNLIINATQAFPSDLEGKKVHVSLKNEAGKAVMCVSDNGTGIPDEIQKKVFEPNFTTKTSGSGLGLAICKKIIEALDGDIYFETKANVGTNFYVTLPITSIEEA